ncbi:MAG: TIGR01212 family radical SAM protein [Bacteroidetes bacterium GWC2_33_15]|nr:MAG: TIGR01212 family radical SAM protein [Bacteroidetes bacterium GWA2_33_15]OFX52321.1 MAG: TIGR01212 family radical SAM protein [Bacteroidetes bacterium GWC2_33_15]OFX64475.1 MAG: TIGR01212 family radical SAM protein [Bacteroidetes bacterium GWB2_32_14]OFX67880.1 MAG: TIGR01212 family radical SAM protein [Bacteroidetes bacterium GWD2_33_33]HAN19416.1 TIGR01212 family radical SAM protein [Bacteroidales bacterium]
MNYPWGHNRRFNSYSEYFKRTLGERVQKVTIDAGFTCPNRDGSKGTGGCTYCNNDAFNPSYCTPEKSIKQQIEEGIEFHINRYRRAKNYLAYFQSYSNTYAPLSKLKTIYNEALNIPGVVGLVIGTRPDCIDDKKLEYFKELSRSHYIIIEYGVESCYNKTLERINRGHTFEQSVETIEKTKQMGIKTGAHFIIGLPGESKEEILNEAKIISSLPLDTIKFHQLQIIKGTAMEKEFNEHPENFTFFELPEYIDFFIQFIERLNPSFVIERFAGEVPPRFLAGPGWGLIRNDQILVKFEKRLEELDTWQGKLLNKIWNHF